MSARNGKGKTPAGYRLGLLGYRIGYSRSPALFDEIFRREGLANGSFYKLFDRSEVGSFLREVREGRLQLDGFNITTPYKTDLIPYLDRLDPLAERVGAVNCVTVSDDGLMTGYNTDVEGFLAALDEATVESDRPLRSALVLGSGGAARAVVVALVERGIPAQTVSRTKGLTYDRLSRGKLSTASLVVNATPLGSRKYPGRKPPIDYEALHRGQFLMDLTYDPEVTPFLREGLRRGCRTASGLPMLRAQALASWRHFRSTKIEGEAGD